MQVEKAEMQVESEDWSEGEDEDVQVDGRVRCWECLSASATIPLEKDSAGELFVHSCTACSYNFYMDVECVDQEKCRCGSYRGDLPWKAKSLLVEISELFGDEALIRVESCPPGDHSFHLSLSFTWRNGVFTDWRATPWNSSEDCRTHYCDCPPP